MTDADIMAFGAHPDDIEIGCGGTLIKLADAGRAIVLVDLVRGELGTRGTVETRSREAEDAARLIGATARENLALRDGHLVTSDDAKRRVVEVIRRWRPNMVFLPYGQDRHPDHTHASQIVYEGTFLAGLPRHETEMPCHRPDRLVYYMGESAFLPSFIVDISDQFDRKLAAIYAYPTQFSPEDPSYPATRLTTAAHDWWLRSRMAYYGSLICARYGEAFLVHGQLRVDDPMALSFSSF